jgi:hypothetical protein
LLDFRLSPPGKEPGSLGRNDNVPVRSKGKLN